MSRDWKHYKTYLYGGDSIVSPFGTALHVKGNVTEEAMSTGGCRQRRGKLSSLGGKCETVF